MTYWLTLNTKTRTLIVLIAHPKTIVNTTQKQLTAILTRASILMKKIVNLDQKLSFSKHLIKLISG